MAKAECWGRGGGRLKFKVRSARLKTIGWEEAGRGWGGGRRGSRRVGGHFNPARGIRTAKGTEASNREARPPPLGTQGGTCKWKPETVGWPKQVENEAHDDHQRTS